MAMKIIRWARTWLAAIVDEPISTGIPLVTTLIALITLVMAPFWAYQWYRQPFIGAFLEPNLVASQISEPGWPAREAGVVWSDRLVAVDGQHVSTTAELEARLRLANVRPVQLTFEKRSGSTFQISITPRPAQFGDLINQFLVPYLVGIILFVSGLWSYNQVKKQLSARSFLFFASTVSITTGAFLDMNTTHHLLLLWTLSLPVAAGSLVHLSLLFPERVGLVKRFPAFRFAHWLIALLIAFEGARQILAPVDPWGYIRIWQWGYAYIIVAMFFFLISLAIRGYFSQSATIRQQSRIIEFGAIIAFGPMLVFYLIPSILGQNPVFYAFLYFPPFLILMLSVAYAIVRYRLLQVDKILADILTYFLVSVVATGIFYLVVSLVSRVLGEEINLNQPLAVAIYLFLLVLALKPLRTLIQKVINRIFYRNQVDYQQILSNLSRALANEVDVRQTFQVLQSILDRAINPDKILLYLYDEDHAQYLPYGDSSGQDLVLPESDALVRLLAGASQTISLPVEPFEVSDSPSMLIPVGQFTTSQALKCWVFSPLRNQDRLIGFIALGLHRSGAPYASDELEFITAVSNQSSLALENVRLLSNIQNNLDETREMTNLMDDIFSSIASGVITIDLQHRITMVNRAASKILGISGNQAIGNPVATTIPALGNRLDELTTRIIDQQTSSVEEEISVPIHGHNLATVRLSATPLRDAHQSTKGATIVIHDLSEQRRLEADREHIRQTFGRVVAPRVRDRLLSSPSGPRMDGTRQVISVLFADIQGFTTWSEYMDPKASFFLLNSYLSLVAQAVLDQEGTLDKFMGDAVMAFWNAPDPQRDHTIRAVRTALEIAQIIKTHRASLGEAFQLHFRIGVTRGEAVVGNVGSSQLFNYTAIGDTVNLAQRIQTFAEPGQILLSEAAYQVVAEQVVAYRLNPVKLKGREKEEIVYELAGLKT